MIIVIDNKDSFTYNLIDYFKTETDKEIVVYERDDVSVDLLRSSNVEQLSSRQVQVNLVTIQF